MIPNIDTVIQGVPVIEYADRTYRVNFVDRIKSGSRGVLSMTMTPETEVYDKISGYSDGLEALIQTIYITLSTERYKFIIYSWDYGVELVDLFGQPMPYVMSELSRRIREALICDNRIQDVVDFEFTPKGKQLRTTFTVITDFGKLDTELEVAV